jgi:ribosome-associated protein
VNQLNNNTLPPLNVETECQFRTSRSGGKGGQNVNKVETKVEVIWKVADSKLLEPHQVMILEAKWENKMDSEGFIHITSQEARSQLENKLIVMKKLHQLIKKDLVVVPPRKRMPKPAAVKNGIRREKAQRSDVKSMRQKPILGEED